MWDGFATVVSKFKKFKSVVAVLEMLIEICDIFLFYGVGLHCIVLYCKAFLFHWQKYGPEK